jgi:hypothetical protein
MAMQEFVVILRALEGIKWWVPGIKHAWKGVYTIFIFSPRSGFVKQNNPPNADSVALLCRW